MVIYYNDYIIRMINDMTRMLMKLVFNIDMMPSDDMLETEEQKESMLRLRGMADEGKLNEAENRLFETVDYGDLSDLKMALLFYSYLNNMTDECLEEHNFSREEIKRGLADIAQKYGLDKSLMGIEDDDALADEEGSDALADEGEPVGEIEDENSEI